MLAFYSFWTSIKVACVFSGAAGSYGLFVMFRNRCFMEPWVIVSAAGRTFMAMMYSGCYAWLLFHRGSMIKWSTFLLGFVPVTWIVVYTIPNWIIDHILKPQRAAKKRPSAED